MAKQTKKFRWYPNVRRYRDKSGKFVGARRVATWVDATSMKFSRALYASALDVVNDYSHEKFIAWATQARQQIESMHVASTVIALGGQESAKAFAAVNGNAWMDAENALARQLGYFDRFMSGLINGSIPFNSRMAARAAMYARAAFGTYENAVRIREQTFGEYREERRTVHSGNPCDDCLEEALLGWQPIGTLRRIGDTVCISNCRCWFEFRTGATQYEYSGLPYGETYYIQGRPGNTGVHDRVPIHYEEMKAIHAKYADRLTRYRTEHEERLAMYLATGKEPKDGRAVQARYEKLQEREAREMRKLFWLPTQDRIKNINVALSPIWQAVTDPSGRSPMGYIRNVVLGALREFKRFVSKKIKYDNAIIIEPNLQGGRAMYAPVKMTDEYGNDLPGNAGLIRLGASDERADVLHEMTHAIEHNNPRILSSVLNFYEMRTLGEKLESLRSINPNYAADEFTKFDRWATAYTGRTPYKDQFGASEATEVLTTALQQFYKNPLEFAESDPQFFNFLLTMLRGDEWER